MPIEQILDADKQRVIRAQVGLVRAGDFFLGGGTSLGLRFGHRLSRDLDWFTPRRFSTAVLEQSLGRLAPKPTFVRKDGAQAVRAYYGSLETSFIAYDQVKRPPEALRIAGTEIPVASLELMAAMKAAALHDRGAKRDFIDIHEICRQPGWSVGRFIEHAARTLPLSPSQVRLALGYFADADREPMPTGCSVSWQEVKAGLQKGVRAWEQSRSQDIER